LYISFGQHHFENLAQNEKGRAAKETFSQKVGGNAPPYHTRRFEVALINHARPQTDEENKHGDNRVNDSKVRS
jgi:hypothetical protein